MSPSDEGFESQFPLTMSPELVEYLGAHADIDQATILEVNHIPELLGGLKSAKFVIRTAEVTPDTPPDPDARIDLGKLAVPSQNLSAFSDAFDAAEEQANSQYPIALFETEQLLATAREQGVEVQTLFIPDSPNPSAKAYLTRLTRLAQDTDLDVVVRVVDKSHGDYYSSFVRLEPVRAANPAEYWNRRESELHIPKSPVTYGRYSRYTLEGIDEVDASMAQDSIDALMLPTTRSPLVFTTFERLQKDYPGSPISDPKIWEEKKGDFTLVSNEAEYAEVMQRYRKERDDLSSDLRNIASANTDILRQWLSDPSSQLHHKLPIIREIANGSAEENKTPARVILAKLGDATMAQTILNEIQTKTGGYGYESLTMMPLGIYLRHDEKLFGEVVEEVKVTVNENPDSHQLLSLMGALYHSHDPRVGELMANYLTVPAHNVEAYASTVLHAAARWLPEYTPALVAAPDSVQRDRSLARIETQVAAFLDAHNYGKLEEVSQHMRYNPALLLPLFFWFANPAHHEIANQSVLRQFKEGGSVLTDSTFENTYLHYRKRYGDLPEISQHFRQ
jgi:hypothetical protein